jgi:hypothetical protein
MAQRPPSAAQAIFPNLPRGTRDVVEQRAEPRSVADAVYGHLRPPQPKPPTHAEVKQAWVDRMLELSGLRRSK